MAKNGSFLWGCSSLPQDLASIILFLPPAQCGTLTLFSALLWLLDENTRIVIQSFLPLVAGLGVGMLFHAPYQALMSALPPKELAAGTGAFFLVRFTGATVGLACVLVVTVHLL